MEKIDITKSIYTYIFSFHVSAFLKHEIYKVIITTMNCWVYNIYKHNMYNNNTKVQEVI